jgi:predicted nucleotidyltransferase
MDRREVIKKVKEFTALISGHFPVKMVILYGSYAKDRAAEHSDIDVAVVVSKIDGDFLEQQARLYKIRRKIDVRIEPILLEDGEDRSGFLEGVLKEGKVVYSN